MIAAYAYCSLCLLQLAILAQHAAADALVADMKLF